MKQFWTTTALSCVMVVSLVSTASAVKKSLVVGIDGLGFGEMGFDVANTPNLDSLINGTFGGGGYRGAYSDQAFAGGQLGTETQQPTVSGPGWSTILTGVWADRHHVVDNSFSGADYVTNPPYLGTVKAALPNLVTASFVNWAPIDANIINAADIDGDPTNDLDSRTIGVDRTIALLASRALTGRAGIDPDVTFVAFDDVDAAGHTCGSSGACYKAEIEDTDALVGQLLSAIEGRPAFDQEDWQIVVTSDHGHRAEGGHGGQSEVERRIPFLVASKDAQQGFLLPIPGPVTHADVAPTVLAHFGVNIPAWYAGTARGDLVGVLGDLNRDDLVDEEDWTALQTGFGTDLTGLSPYEAYLTGDLNTDGRHTLDDFVLFRSALLAAGGSAAQLGALAIPEPAAISLWLLGLGCLPWRRRR